MNTNFFVRAKSAEDGSVRKISIEEICKAFSIDQNSFELISETDCTKEEIKVTPNYGYGFMVDGAIEDDLYGLAAIEFNDVDKNPRREGFLTFVYPGLYSSNGDPNCCESDELVFFINQQKRSSKDPSRKIAFYDPNMLDVMSMFKTNNYDANTSDEEYFAKED